MNFVSKLLLGFTCTATFLLFATSMSAQSPVGVWKTVDDVTGKAKSHIEIYEENGKFHGKIVKLLLVAEDSKCTKCVGDKKDKPYMNMVVLWDLKPYSDYWSYGKIMDPNKGKTYKASIWLIDDNTLAVKGYIGVSLIGRKQKWYRVK